MHDQRPERLRDVRGDRDAARCPGPALLGLHSGEDVVMMRGQPFGDAFALMTDDHAGGCGIERFGGREDVADKWAAEDRVEDLCE